MPKNVESPARFYGAFNDSPPGLIRRELRSALPVFPETSPIPTSSQNSLKDRVQIADSKISNVADTPEMPASAKISPIPDVNFEDDDTTMGSSFSESEEEFLAQADQVAATESNDSFVNIPSHDLQNEDLYPCYRAIQRGFYLKDVRNFKDQTAPLKDIMVNKSHRKGEIKEIRFFLILASFLVFTVIFTIPALCYYDKEMKKITNDMQEYYLAFVDKFSDLKNKIEGDLKLNFDDRKQLIDEIERELGLRKSLDFFSSLSGSLEWVKNLRKMADEYPKENKNWNQFTDLEQAEFILHLKKKGAFDKHSQTTMHFVIDLFKPNFESKPQNGGCESDEEVWEANMSSMIDACLDGRYGPDRKRTEKIVTAKIKEFREKDLKDGYDPMPLIHQLWKAGLFDDHKFFMTCNLLKQHLGISRPYIIEIYNSLPNWKPPAKSSHNPST